jgi:putative membrane protein
MKSILLWFPVVPAMLAGCAPIPGMGPLFGPDTLMTLLLIAVIVLLGYLFKSWRERNKSRAQASTETILSERYARGEISREDFVQMRKDIEEH